MKGKGSREVCSAVKRIIQPRKGDSTTEDLTSTSRAVRLSYLTENKGCNISRLPVGGVK